MAKKIILIFVVLANVTDLFAQNQISINGGYGKYLLNSENSMKVLEGKKIRDFYIFGAEIKKEHIYGFNISFEYNYFQNTIKNAMHFTWTDETGNDLGEFTGDYILLNHTFDLNYYDRIDKNFSYGLGPSIVITNRVLDINLPSNFNLELYDKLASSGIGINGFVEFSTPLSNGDEYFFFNTKLKLRYTHSIWFDEGLRKLDDYNQEFFTAQISIGLGYYFSD